MSTVDAESQERVYDVRLAHGSAGLVEILTDDGWLPMWYVNSSVSEEIGWNSNAESKVLCRQLGYAAINSSKLDTDIKRLKNNNKKQHLILMHANNYCTTICMFPIVRT